MQFARSLEAQKLAGQKAVEKRDGQKDENKRGSGRQGEKKERIARHEAARPSIFIRGERCPETFKAAAKAIRNPASVTRDSANFTSHYFDRG